MRSKENKKASNHRAHGVLMEDLDAKLDLVLEGHLALDKKIDQHHEESVEFREEINFKFGIVFERFDEVDERFGRIEERFKGTEGKINGIEGMLREIRSELSNKVDRTEFELFRKEFGQLKNA
jgi:hypothetical protein